MAATGKNIGVDPSENMLKTGKDRCQGHENVEFAAGVADNLPVSDGTADKAVG
ncbi:methyltransferase domain-containing protein [Roseovarius phycicola]|uniref:methyltransferase domain-containing protein n=1 Tax=Roseovarius phycicola TaxID=3080976 RepID=UPI0030CD0AB0